MNLKYPIALLTIALAVASCKKEEEPENNTQNPPPAALCGENTYCFTDAEGNLTVDYSGQTARLNQLNELSSYLKTSNTSGVSLSADILRDMFSNNNGAGSTHFSESAVFPGKQLEDKCFLPNVGYYHEMFDAIEIASHSVVPGSNGIAGVVVGIADPSKKYLLDANGREITQFIEKGLMGDVFYYQAMEIYISGVEAGSFNYTDAVNPANGLYYTEAEHKFDEAFGYFGAPVDYPANTSAARFIARYCTARDGALECIDEIFNAFIGARSAISAVNQTEANAQMAIVREQWHRITAGTALYYLKASIATMNDPAIKCHNLSEGWAFIRNLAFNGPHALQQSQINEIHAAIGDNFYETSVEDLNAAITLLLNYSGITLDEFADL